ncbi:hypothetical protein BU25DRAFT_408286 [Macroventuria anomochaeta]|uniref:Uncharacterized protein n=1 Tax=Macroventuria anomochaeta TaxID=301207 RepID=A0ACB6S7T1_9PLEO|nr:uncharacterized protein BU25DRAFT_408286 [Macroventuria anomochaeta]KAF2630336.1 hypothetical protein BU25DRAFT_408286 [Macroventuria anomochaeta]
MDLVADHTSPYLGMSETAHNTMATYNEAFQSLGHSCIHALKHYSPNGARGMLEHLELHPQLIIHVDNTNSTAVGNGLETAHHLLSSIANPYIDGHPFDTSPTVRRWAPQTIWRLDAMQIKSNEMRMKDPHKQRGFSTASSELQEIDIAIDISTAARTEISEDGIVCATLR